MTFPRALTFQVPLVLITFLRKGSQCYTDAVLQIDFDSAGWLQISKIETDILNLKMTLTLPASEQDLPGCVSVAESGILSAVFQASASVAHINVSTYLKMNQPFIKT